MTPILTFVIPVRHPANAANWKALKENLSATARSIAAQTHSGWKAIVVANAGADLPPLAAGFDVARVDFPPNPLHELGFSTEEARLTLGLDKGRRVLAGMLAAGATGYFMVVDDDDFVSRRLTAYVAKHFGGPGWYIRDGYLWGSGGKLFASYSDFSELCGTSLIIRTDLYKLPTCIDDAEEEYVRHMLGSHKFAKSHFAQAGTPLSPLPFPGAAYRIGHTGTASKHRGLIGFLFYKKQLLRRPWDFPRRALSLRYITPALEAEFFGTPSVVAPATLAVR